MMDHFLEVLEFPDSINKIDNSKDFEQEKIYKETEKFIINNFSKNENLIVSLSGGVDSAVLITLLQKIKTKMNINIIAAHINYCNRNETHIEEEFLKFWCKKNNFIFEILKIEEIKRGEEKRSYYENYIRDKRYTFYQDLVKKYNCKGVFLGHHLNDLQENIMCNIMKGRNIFDLTVMRKESIINDVTIYRPFLDFYKDTIYNFSHENNIPYFKDTTPDWSNRGKLRNKLFPLLQEIYGTQCLDHLLYLGNSSDEWKDVIDTKIIKDFVKNNIQIKKKGVIIDYEEYSNFPFNFWNSIFLELCHNNLGVSMVSINCIKNMIPKMNKSKISQITFKKDWKVYIYNKKIIIVYEKYTNIDKYDITKEIVTIPEENNKKNKEINNYNINIYNLLEDNISYILPYDEESRLTICYNKKNLKNFSKIPMELLKVFPIMNYEKNQNFCNSKFYKIEIKLI